MYNIWCIKEMFINLCSAQKKLNSETVQSKLVSSSLLLLPGGAAFSISARKTSIVSESHAEVNSSNFLGLKHSLCLSAHEHKSEKGWDTQGRERVIFFPPLCRSGECEGGYCRDSSPLTSFTCVRQADYKVWIALPKHKTRLPTAALFAIYTW